MSADRYCAAASVISMACLLHLPKKSALILQARIVNIRSKLTNDTYQYLLSLLDKATDTPFTNRHRQLFIPVFGVELLDSLLKDAKEGLQSITPIYDESPEHSLPLAIEKVSHDLLRKPRIRELTKKYQPLYSVEIKSGAGFAEYWPKSLTKKASDELWIVDNVGMYRPRILYTSLAHEVIGHGVFYTAVEQASPQFFDHGAITLIEGWATYCECYAVPTRFQPRARYERLQSLSRFDEQNAEVVHDAMTKEILEAGYSQDDVDAAILYFFQYPGMSASYALGLLWFEQYFLRKTPSDFFDELSGKYVGDFFKVW
jgi:hypothetical protein